MAKRDEIPADVLTQHLAVLGKTGSGKSSVLRVLVERQLEAGQRVCVIDPKGDWYGLRSSPDGKSPGYPVVIFGGEHADVPLNQHAGANVAELVASGNRPCVIDLGAWMVGERTRFFIDFAHSLFKSLREPLWLVIDEAHNFAPQGKILDPDAGKMLHWANRLASEGRGKGLVIFSASQRPQKVHKDFLTCAETLVAMRVIHALDRKAIKDWVDGAGDPDKGREVIDTLAGMPRGEGWVWSPEAGFGPKRVAFPLFRTFDSFAAPKVGSSKRKLTGWAAVDLADVTKRLEQVVADAKANDPVELKREVAALKKQLAKQEPDPERVKSAVADAVAAAYRARDKEQAATIREYERRLRDAGEKLAKVHKLATGLATVTRMIVDAPPAADVAPPVPPPSEPTPARRVIRALRVNDDRDRAKNGRDADDSDLAAGERAVLTAIAGYPEGVAVESITVLTGYKKSTRNLYLQRLAASGYIQRGPLITATDQGIDALGDFEPLPTGEALRDFWLAKLPAGEVTTLQAIIEAYPDAIAPDALSDATGYKKSTRNLYVQRLRARQLLDGRGTLRASDRLFD